MCRPQPKMRPFERILHWNLWNELSVDVQTLDTIEIPLFLHNGYTLNDPSNVSISHWKAMSLASELHTHVGWFFIIWKLIALQTHGRRENKIDLLIWTGYLLNYLPARPIIFTLQFIRLSAIQIRWKQTIFRNSR